MRIILPLTLKPLNNSNRLNLFDAFFKNIFNWGPFISFSIDLRCLWNISWTIFAWIQQKSFTEAYISNWKGKRSIRIWKGKRLKEIILFKVGIFAACAQADI